MQPILRLALPGTLQSFYISLLFQTFGQNKQVNNGVHDLSTQIGDGFADIIGSQQTVTLGVDHLTLIVSHIIVFKQVLADIEVATFQLRWAFRWRWSPYDALSHGGRLISVVCFDRFVI